MYKLTTLALLVSISLGALVQGESFSTIRSASPFLAGVPGKDCVASVLHEGTPTGKVVSLGGMDTYVSVPKKPTSGPKKVLLFFADVYGPLYPNMKLIQDFYASNGYTVLGPDYFFGDPIYPHLEDPTFNLTQWISEKVEIANEATPKWLEVVRQNYGVNGKNVKYTAVGYCFGGPFALNLAGTDDVVAAGFGHPAFLTEEQFQNVKQPLLLTLAETDDVFPKPNSRRAEDILVENKAVYHIQTFSNTTHGFVTRGDPAIENDRWSSDTALRTFVEWSNRFTA
ncbi:hypothetical protein NLJ89_g10877 [Agrocybe chaxingu]|uniref:Dienelactone hydrolase domain-containing protein n=1 Tax=Agrocybe chaxingu TaxID=84603 RepID=A0A9W8JPS8_9AGAR|nr:hypothetical protein NLJ89_g10877 [Agrocybe chaxingu]